MPIGYLADSVQAGWLAEGVDREDCFGPRGNGGLDQFRVDVTRLRLNVHEDRAGALVEDAVGRGYEAERVVMTSSPSPIPKARTRR